MGISRTARAAGKSTAAKQNLSDRTIGKSRDYPDCLNMLLRVLSQMAASSGAAAELRDRLARAIQEAKAAGLSIGGNL
jgi:hypothetical protein